MALAIFDLDHTLLSGDSDYLWGEYMVTNEIVDRAEYQQINQSFLEDYHRGELDNDKYLRFALHPLTLHPLEKLQAWRTDYVENWIKPIIANGASGLLQKHRQQGDTLIMVSATNYFITRPIADLLNIPNLLSTRPELIDNRYTGNYVGIPTFKEGKVTALNEWLKDSPHSLNNSYFYSDSISDLPLLQKVSHPVVVNPDDPLTDIARQNQWPVIDLRN
ncbi:MAG: HAD family hydrolase [Gammaproteobacteria bacterium]|nr:HAD family hydrolase [Gammaproteobacteria bacterium]